MFKVVFILAAFVLTSTISIKSKLMKSTDPFESLGIADINPKKILEELDKENKPKASYASH